MAPALDGVTASTPPMLKGIISGARGLQAVFSPASAPTDYLVVGRGERIDGYQIEEVAADRVFAVSAGGENVTFNLRGVGEHP